jgi:hypothetical protein
MTSDGVTYVAPTAKTPASATALNFDNCGLVNSTIGVANITISNTMFRAVWLSKKPMKTSIWV